MLTSSQQQPTSWDLAGTTVTFQKAVSPEATLVRQALVDRGLETPLIENGLNRDQKLAIVRDAFTDITTVMIDDIDLTSTCEHHFVTIDGQARVAYLPGSKIIGLSKINRIVRFFAQRPQVQERLTQQILVALQTLLETEDVAVSMEAVHYCVKARGVMDTNSRTRTTSLGGIFKEDPAARSEFLR